MPATGPTAPRRRLWRNLLFALADVYLAALVGWGALRLAFGERWWWLFLATTLAPWLFLPLAGAVPLALASRRRSLLAGVSAGLLLSAPLMSASLLPPVRPALAAGGAQLRVMSFNVYVDNATPDRAAAVIRAAGADLVALQELTPEMAAALRGALADIYPHMLLDPRPGVTGMGLLSRHPLRAVGTLPGEAWVGAPQVVALDVGGQEVMAVNLHAIPPLSSFAGSRTEGVRERERQAAAVVALAAEHAGPFLALGDFNSTPYNRSYQIVRAALGDAWAAEGGLGFTWPAPEVGLSPVRVTQIDYIFHSRHWAALGAAVGEAGGGSDHLPITATLALTPP